jgi:tumor protein p53-inducible protein 3
LALLGGRVLEKFDAGPILFKRLAVIRFLRLLTKIRGSTLRSRTPEYQEKLKTEFLEHALPRIVKGEFEANIDRVLDWTQIREAHEAMENNEIMGKIICTVSD